MDTTIVLFVVNGLLAVIMYFMKLAHDGLRENLKDHQMQLEHIKDKYYKKEDFKEFKEELWFRLDEMKLDFKREIERLHK